MSNKYAFYLLRTDNYCSIDFVREYNIKICGETVIIFYSTIKDSIAARIIKIKSDGTYKAKGDNPKGDNPKTNPVPIKSQLLDETQISKTQILGKALNFSLNPILFILLVRGIQIILALLLTKLFYYKLFGKEASQWKSSQ